MCYCSPTIKAHRLFKEQCDERTDSGLYEEEMKRALGQVIIKCSNFFTADIQPIRTEQGLAYAISQLGRDDVIVIRDDDFPDMELPDWCSSELLPLGLRKAAALSEILHAENIKRFNINENEDEKKYIPQNPYYAYLKCTGQTMPLDELALKYIFKIANSKIFEILLEIGGYALFYAVGGALLALLQDGNIRGYMCAGTLLGVAYYLIDQFYNYMMNRR